ncbi:MAG: trigger factor [Bacteroidota bacterium]
MNITKENVQNQTLSVKVEVLVADYSEKVGKALREYQKKASMPGFRPGKVPTSVVKKMYLKSTVAEEVNRIATDNLLEYIKENDIEILGGPMPNFEKTILNDWEDNIDYTFYYDLGLSPKPDVTVADVSKLEYLKIIVDEKFVDEKINEMRRRFGKFSTPEASEESDWLYGTFSELNEDGTLKEDGIKNNASMLIESVKLKKDKKQFIGLKIGDTVDFIPTDIMTNMTDVAAMLGKSKEDAEGVKSKFRYEIINVNRVELAELNQEFFDKAFGKDKATSEKELRDLVKQEYEKAYSAESDRKLLNDVSAKLIEKSKMELPEDFLKNWIRNAGETRLSEEQIENEFGSYALSLKWQILENSILRDNKIEVNEEEVMEHAKGLVKNQLAMYGKMDSTDEELQSIALKVFQNKEELKKLYDKLYDEKLTAFFKENVDLKVKEVSLDKFLEEIKK